MLGVDLAARQELVVFLGERYDLSRVVIRISNRGMRQEPLAREAFDIVFHPRTVAVVGKLGQVVHPHDAELANFSECVNLGIPQGIFFVPVRVFGSASLRKNRFDPLLAPQGPSVSVTTFPALPGKAGRPVLLPPDILTAIPG